MKKKKKLTRSEKEKAFVVAHIPVVKLLYQRISITEIANRTGKSIYFIEKVRKTLLKPVCKKKVANDPVPIPVNEPEIKVDFEAVRMMLSER